MKKFDVELSVGYCASVDGIEAETREEAIAKAKAMVEENPQWYCDSVEIEGVNFAQEKK